MDEQLQLDAGLPANVNCERTILGAILLESSALEQIEGRLRADDFSLDSHRRLFMRMCELARTGHPIDIVTLSHVLERYKEVESVGGIAYIAGLTEGVPRRAVVGEWVSILKDKAILRKLILACSAASQRAANNPDGGLALLSSTLGDLSDIESSSMEGADLESVGQWLDQNDVFAERKAGIFTGIDEYDEITFGLQKGELTVVAGRSGMGKTSFAGTLSWQMGLAGKSVAIFLNEQSKASFVGRMLCGRSGVSFNSYKRTQLDWVEKQYIEDAVKEFRMFPLFWDQRSSMSVASIRAKSARLKRSGELDVIIVDQLSRVSGEGLYQKGMRSDEVIGEKVSALKGMAVDLDVPLVLMHQLNRDTTKNDSQRPQLQNLKGSGSTEEHADVVALLHRPFYYDRKEENKGKAEIVIAKNRDGATGTVHCEFVQECCLWRNKGKS